MEKMTQVKALQNALTVVTDKETSDKLKEILVALEKRKAHKVSKKTQDANRELKAIIYNALATLGKGVTVTELQKSTDALADFTNQKITSLLKEMREEGTVDSEKVGKSNKYFALIEGEDDEEESEEDSDSEE